MMKNIHLIKLEKYNDPSQFEQVSDGIYKSLHEYGEGIVGNGHFVTAISFTLEEELGEIKNRQYPLEDILDKFLAHVSEFIQNEPDNPVMILELCTQDWLEEMQELVKIAGKRVYNKAVSDDEDPMVELVIEG